MQTETKNLDQDLKNLRIDRTKRREPEQPSKWATRWIVTGIIFLLILGVGATLFRLTSKATEVETFRVTAKGAASADDAGIILNAAGYIVAHHKIQVTPKVM